MKILKAAREITASSIQGTSHKTMGADFSTEILQARREWHDIFEGREKPATKNTLGIPGGSVVKKHPPANSGDMGLIPGSERFPGEGNCNPPQYSCLGNSMDRGAWWATVDEVTKSWT